MCIIHYVVVCTSNDLSDLAFTYYNLLKSIIYNPLGLFPNFSKCENFFAKTRFHDAITTRSNVPNLVILVSPIGDKSFCEDFLSSTIRVSSILHQQLKKLVDPQIALTLLRQCAAFCKFTHIARTTPPILIQSTLAIFDDNFRACIMQCTAIDLSPNCPAWKQATLSLSHGGLGLRSVFLHCSAAYISSISASFPDHINSPYHQYL